MNITRARQQERLMKISRIISTLELAKKKGKVVDENKLLMECCMDWGISERTAREYLKVAKFKVK